MLEVMVWGGVYLGTLRDLHAGQCATQHKPVSVLGLCSTVALLWHKGTETPTPPLSTWGLCEVLHL